MLLEVCPVGVERRCNFTWESLGEFDGNPAIQFLKRAENIAEKYKQVRAPLLAALYTLGNHPEKTLRHAVLRLRRCISKESSPSQSDLKYITSVSDNNLNNMLKVWIEARSQEISLCKEAENAYELALLRGRNVISKFLEKNNFACGIHVSSRRLLSQALDYAEAINNGKPIDKKLRNIEDRLVSYLFRAVSKPTPFGSFTTIFATYFGEEKLEINPKQDAKISRDILHWIENHCSHTIPEIAEELPLRLNNTLTTEGQFIHAFVRGRDGTSEMLGAERFIRLKSNSLVLNIFSLVSENAYSVKQLKSTLIQQKGFSKKELEVIISGLLQAGILERDFNIADYEKDFPNAAINALSSLTPMPSAHSVTAVFKRLGEFESNISSVCAKQRTTMTRDVEACLENIARAAGITLSSTQEIRDVYFEDLAGGLSEKNDKLDLADATIIARLAPALMLFDTQASHRHALFDIFCEVAPNGVDYLPLLDFYREFRGIGDTSLLNRLNFSSTEIGKQAIAFRKEMFQLIDDIWQDAGCPDEIDLRSTRFENWLDSLPPIIDCPSMSVYMQRCGTSANRWVLNNAGMGFGSAMSRFTQLLDSDAKTFSTFISEYLQRHYNNMNLTEIIGVLGANSNIHKPLFDTLFLYPGCRALPNDYTITARDVMVYADSENKTLRLRRKDGGSPINLVSLNFIHPAAGPSFYRFLHMFTPYWTYRSSDFADQLTVSSQFRLPRIIYGSLVLCRRTFRVHASDIREIYEKAKNDLSLYYALDEWRQNLKIPNSVYYRELPSNDTRYNNAEPSIETLIALRRGRLRKPHWMDFGSPMLSRIFRKQVASLAPTQIVQLQEALPNHSIEPLRNDSAREYIFQLDLLGLS